VKINTLQLGTHIDLYITVDFNFTCLFV